MSWSFQCKARSAPMKQATIANYSSINGHFLWKSIPSKQCNNLSRHNTKIWYKCVPSVSHHSSATASTLFWTAVCEWILHPHYWKIFSLVQVNLLYYSALNFILRQSLPCPTAYLALTGGVCLLFFLSLSPLSTGVGPAPAAVVLLIISAAL